MKKYCYKCMIWQKNLGYCPITTNSSIKMGLYTNADNCKSFYFCVEAKDLVWESISNDNQKNQYNDEVAKTKFVKFHIYLRNQLSNPKYRLTISEFNSEDYKHDFDNLDDAKKYAIQYYKQLFESLIK